MDKQILVFIHKLRRRLSVQLALDIFPLCLSIGFLLGLFHVLPACFYPFYYAGNLGIFWIFAAVLGGLCYFLSHVPKEIQAAHAGDAVIGKERLLTAWELLGNGSPIACLQKEDTLSHITACNTGRDFPFHFSARRIAFCCLTCFFFFFFLLLPSDAKLKAQKLHAVKQEAKEETASLNKLQKELKKEKELETEPGTDGKAVKNPETTGGKLLAHGKFDNVQELIEEAKQELSAAKSKHDLEHANVKLNAKLSAYKETSHAYSYEESEAFSELLEKIQKLQPESLKHNFASQNPSESAGSTSSAGGAAGENETNPSGNQNNGNTGSNSRNENTGNTNSNSRNENNGNTGSNSKNENSGNTSSNSGSENSGNTNSNSGSENNRNTNNNSGSKNSGNTNNNSGNENGGNTSSNSGSENSGNMGGNSGNSNNGNGTNGTGNPGSGNGNGSGKNYGSKKGIERESKKQQKEQITIMKESLGSDQALTGTASNDGNSQKQPGNHTLSAGTKKDFEDVISDYTDSAYAALENNQVPSSMESVVRNYFTNLNS